MDWNILKWKSVALGANICFHLQLWGNSTPPKTSSMSNLVLKLSILNTHAQKGSKRVPGACWFIAQYHTWSSYTHQTWPWEKSLLLLILYQQQNIKYKSAHVSRGLLTMFLDENYVIISAHQIIRCCLLTSYFLMLRKPRPQVTHYLVYLSDDEAGANRSLLGNVTVSRCHSEIAVPSISQWRKPYSLW